MRGPSLRLFAALELPEPVRESLAAIEALAPQLGRSWTPPRNLHLTLKFLGQVLKMANTYVFTKVFHGCNARVVRSERLSAGPATVSELAAPFDMQLPSFVQHLSILEQSRLVKSKKRGRVRTYEIAPERFKVVEDWLTARRRLWEERLDRLDQYVKQLEEKESGS